MRVSDEEQKMLDGGEGPAVLKAMDLLVRYGEALGAERLLRTNNACADCQSRATLPSRTVASSVCRGSIGQRESLDEMFRPVAA